MRGRCSLLVVFLLFAGCGGDAEQRLDELERRIDRLEDTVATSTTVAATTTTLDITAVPPAILPTEQARTRLQRLLPAQLGELWEVEWCRDHPDELGDAGEALGVNVPSSAVPLNAWIDEGGEAFGSACAAALAVADPGALEAAAYAGAVDARISAVTAEIVDEVASDTQELQETLEDLSGELRSFCGANPELVFDAAFALGRLPQGASDDLEVYWAVTRPLEYAAACRAAYESR
jgi:hypothetical protein